MMELPFQPPLGTPELDAQYNNRAMVPEHVGMYEAWQPLCGQVLRDFPSHQGVAYGASKREIVDIVLPDGPGPHPLLVYIHGGYWMSRDISDQTFLARAYADAGIAFALIEYDLIPSVRMANVIRQCRAATQWLYDHAADYGIDRERIFVSGHSAGGHLTAVLAATDWPAETGGPADLMKGGIALSGIYELAPIQAGYMQETLRLTDEEVERDSPLHFADAPKMPLLVVPGGGESDAFRWQSRSLVNAWNAKGGDLRYLEPAGCNHFTILAEFADPDSELARATMALVKTGG